MSAPHVSTADEEGGGTPFSAATLDSLRLEMSSFVREREWAKFHTPRNLVLALAGEAGELCECFQWKGESCTRGLPEWSESEKTHLGEELSDVLLYLVRLSDVCGIDLSAAAARKMQLNRLKYPAHLARGSSAKYTAYASDASGSGGASAGEASAAASPPPAHSPRRRLSAGVDGAVTRVGDSGGEWRVQARTVGTAFIAGAATACALAIIVVLRRARAT